MDLDQFEGHTPGPLACVELMAFAAGFAVEDGEGRTVARIMKAHGAVPLPARANAALFAAAPDLLAEVRRLTAEADAMRRERDELAAEVERMRAELKGPDRHETWKDAAVSERVRRVAAEAKRDELAARLANAPVAIVDTRDALGLCAPTEGDFPGLYAMRGRRVALVPLDQRASAADDLAPAAAPEQADGCGACGDSCRSRGSCRLADESPRPAARPCRCGPDGCPDRVSCPRNGGAA